MPENQKNTTYLITLGTGDGSETYQVTAAYASVDERLFPGFVLLKDEDGSIVGFVPAGAQPFIRRSEADRTYGTRPAARAALPAAPTPQPPRATPADLRRLVGVGHKAGDV